MTIIMLENSLDKITCMNCGDIVGYYCERGGALAFDEVDQTPSPEVKAVDPLDCPQIIDKRYNQNLVLISDAHDLVEATRKESAHEIAELRKAVDLMAEERIDLRPGTNCDNCARCRGGDPPCEFKCYEGLVDYYIAQAKAVKE